MPQPSDAPRLLFVTCGDPDEDALRSFGSFAAWFARGFGEHARLREVDARADALSDALLAEVDGVVVSGSRHAAYEPHPWIAPLELLLRAAVERGTPTLGVCFGHQVLAQALGGTVQRNPLGRELGTVEIEANEHAASDPLLAPLGSRFLVQVTHLDTVTRPPEGAVVLARSNGDHCQAYRYRRAWGVQFHPEVHGPLMRSYVQTRSELLAQEGIDARALREAVRDTDAGERLLRRFAALAAQDAQGVRSER